MKSIKNPDVAAALACLVTLGADGACALWAGGHLFSQDLQVALGAFLLAALARWKFMGPKKPTSQPEPSPSEEATLAPEEIEDEPTNPVEAPKE